MAVSTSATSMTVTATGQFPIFYKMGISIALEAYETENLVKQDQLYVNG